MIDRTTLPAISAGSTITVGQRFTIVGRHFNIWPNEIVLGLDDGSVLTEDLPSYKLMQLVAKTDTSLVFEVTGEHEFVLEHVFSSFASRFTRPRRLLEYVEG